MFTEKSMKVSKDLKFILTSFIGWRALLFIFFFIAIYFLPLQKNFLGGGLTNYLKAPWFWSWANFDGEHYLAIAQNGYGFGEQAFFPLYPLLIKTIGRLFGGGMSILNLSGQLISTFSFFTALLGLYKLIKLDYSEKTAIFTIFLLLIFPTSFYFASVYTESFFFAFVVWSFYFARKANWVAAAILGCLATATRFTGILLLPALLTEFFMRRPLREFFPKALWLLLIPLGLSLYMYYLKASTGDALGFIHSLPTFGEQRSSIPIILPQVFYRYIFKIFPNLNYAYFPSLFTTFLEFFVASSFLVLVILSFFRLRLSYSLFSLGAYLLPTLTGSFSSLPRYVLIIFPAFILMANYLSKAPRYTVLVVFLVLGICLGIATSLFLRGYFIS